MRLILLLLFCISVQAQTITVSGTTYQLTGDDIMSDPNTYLHQFVEDALARGHDFTGVRGIFRLDNISSAGYSIRSVSCRGSFEIVIQNYYWDNQGFEGKRDLIYHELGHALMKIDHVCYDFDGVFPLAYRAYRNFPNYEFYSGDIMWALRECNRPNDRSPYQVIPLTWDEKLDRMFNPGYQTYIVCGSNKSSGPIIDY